MTRIFIDADACPVRDETYRVALRYGLHTYVVSNRMIAVPDTPLIERVVVTQGMDVADDWIAEHATTHDIVISADIPLAARCVANGACVLEPRGRILDQDAIGMALAMRNLMTDLRDTGAITQGSRGFTRADRSTFLSALDTAVVRARRQAAGHNRRPPVIPPSASGNVPDQPSDKK
ncbi:YaiI/YqxD family protein [Komagataeibacter oboediens]|uniref:YaiI/YqxD family protein n=1 Tax=Komagataeibacter oboediens TaxID=65958 RepID=UPI0023DC865E|nr:YaiI/YqxD family protein [Komagataeibacter oboediens]WEQ52040.1 YaiI/YqxD family protein [Komagataeibacter oboediens]